MEERNLTDRDIELIVEQIKKNSAHNCRFNDITHEDLFEAVRAFKHFNKIMNDSKSTFRRTVISVLVVLLMSLLGWGVIAEIKRLVE